MAEGKIFSVFDVTNYIKDSLEQDLALQDIKVMGEVSKPGYSGGHLYFTIKDDSALINCVMWKSAVQSGLKFELETGQKVIVTGSVKVYAPGGRYQIQIRKIEKEGIGAKLEELEKLKYKLKEEGLFDAAHKKPIPPYPKRVGIITSRTGAVIEDIKRTAREANAYVQLILYPAIVQGKDAAKALIKGIERFEEEGVDTIIIGRGGGSIEDLWCFNDEALARKIYSCNIPIISAVGHQTDRTLADEVSDLSVATPTAAAMSAVPRLDAAFKELDAYKDRFKSSLQSKTNKIKAEIADAELSIKRRSPQMRLKDINRQLDGFMTNFNRNIEARLYNYDKKLTVIKQDLHRLMRASYESVNKSLILLETSIKTGSPKKKLSAGYSYVENEAGENIRSISMVKPGESLKLVFADGYIKVKAEEIKEENG